MARKCFDKRTTSHKMILPNAIICMVTVVFLSRTNLMLHMRHHKSDIRVSEGVILLHKKLQFVGHRVNNVS